MLSAVEMFSGIGGWHMALSLLGRDLGVQIERAFDTNLIANTVYCENFGLQPEPASLEKIAPERLSHAVWFLSPPCQPHTTAGKQLGAADSRSDALAHLVSLLPRARPKFVILENVPPFETSSSCEQLIKALEDINLNVVQFQLSSTDFGTPNERKRYYLVARERAFASSSTSEPLRSIPGSKYFDEHGKSRNDPKPIQAFLVEDEQTDLKPRKQLLRPGYKHDIVTPSSFSCSTFTKGYGHHTFGGPLLCTDNSIKPLRFYECGPDSPVRLFSSREIMSLMGFPKSFRFPPHTSEGQRRRLLGNSLNIEVAKEIIQFVFSEAA
ncbi:hypothetical protein NDN08_002853 [Rhodosorus marinus]|uniref:tRNA (cytosine(38)-C(5))-methyltransferase n=1 Tax=Rhodosorus marinus TaxID=101924 RepID=A0AAV8UUX2_9RHOD|nr:hypothetical protein NDN08_002853 [Rhodosorus marinus]